MIKFLLTFGLCFIKIVIAFTQINTNNQVTDLNYPDSLESDTFIEDNFEIIYHDSLFTEQFGLSIIYSKGINTSLNIDQGVGIAAKLGHNIISNASKKHALYWGFGFDFIKFNERLYPFSKEGSVLSKANAFSFISYLDYDLKCKKAFSYFISCFTGVRIFNSNQQVKYNNGSITSGGGSSKEQTFIYGLGIGFKVKISKHKLVELRYQKNFGYAETINDIASYSSDYKGTNITFKDTNANLDMILLSILFNLKPTSKR